MSKMIFHNGVIHTMEQGAEPEAVLIGDGRILRTGAFADLAAEAPDAERVDLQGRTLIPAFIDPHSHITALARTLSLANLSGCTTAEQLGQRLRDFIRDNGVEDGQWVMGVGYDHNDLEGHCHPTTREMDLFAPGHPIVITHASGHMGCANSLALEQLGIDRNTPDPEGGLIGHYPDGTPNGYLEENAFLQLKSRMPHSVDPETQYALMDKAQQVYLSNGITTAQDGMVRKDEFALLDAMAKAGRLSIDVVGYVEMKNNRQLMLDHPEYTGDYNNGFRIGGYKILLDGSPQGRTAWMSRPYENAEDGYRGYPIYSDEAVEAFAETSLKEGRQLLAHCNGDAASEQYIRAFAAAEKKTGLDGSTRPVMIHAQTVRRDQLDAMKPLGIMPSFFTSHTYHWGDVHLVNFGKERAQAISPAHSAAEKGIVFTFHQDTPVVPCDMLFTIWCAVNRLSKHGADMGAAERVTPRQALEAVTINAAYQYFEENEKGSIREGKKADLVILSDDPLAVDPMKIKDIRVLETYKDGVSLYRA